MSLKETQLMLKKLCPKIRQIAVECRKAIMVAQEAVAVVHVDHHPEWVVVVEAVAAAAGDLWVVDLISVVAVEVVVDIDQVVEAAVVVMEPEIMVIELHPTVVVATAVIWVVAI